MKKREENPVQVDTEESENKDRLSYRLANAKPEEAAPLIVELYLQCVHMDKKYASFYKEFHHHLKYESGHMSAVMMLIEKNAGRNITDVFSCEEWTDNGVKAEHVRASAWIPGAKRVYAATPALALAGAIAEKEENKKEIKNDNGRNQR